jgi:hypothetical protein
MAQYLSPGVYVEEIPSAVQAIVGVSTSTAGFIGKTSKTQVVIPPGPVSHVEKETVGTGNGTLATFNLAAYPVVTRPGTFQVWTSSGGGTPAAVTDATLDNDIDASPPVSKVVFTTPPTNGDAIVVSYDAFVKAVRGEIAGKLADTEMVSAVSNEVAGTGDGAAKEFALAASPVITRRETFKVTVTESGVATEDKTAVLQNDSSSTPSTSKVVFARPPARGASVKVTYLAGKELRLASHPVLAEGVTINAGATELVATDYDVVNDFRERASFLQIKDKPAGEQVIMAGYLAALPDLVMSKRKIGAGDASTTIFALDSYPVQTDAGLFAIRLGDYKTAAPEASSSVTLSNDAATKKALVTFTTPPALNQEVWADYIVQPVFSPLTNTVKLCTSFSDYRKYFGSFSADPELSKLANAVYGFFHNGGSRCFVAVMASDTDIDAILEQFAAVDEIAIVAAPGIDTPDIRDKIVAHCKVATQDRFAIFDSPKDLQEDDLTLLTLSNPDNVLPDFSDYAAFYFPWIKVADPAEKTMYPKGDGRVFVPPSGHVAGIYARVDNTRGVFKAPANEVVLGALDLRYNISKAQQDGLNPQGVNCIRELNGARKVWGARTIGGNANGEWRYINVRRTMLYLRESIDEGTQWAVFEPNDQNLWAKIKRNVDAFLDIQWRAGMLFGSTAQEAFYVKCDAETNPPELREIGQVVTEIGVAIVRPAEFVIFRISQWQPQQGG